MAIFNININAAILPIARDDSYIVYPNTLNLLDVTINDFLGQNPITTILTIEIPPVNGGAAAIGNKIQYSPNINFIGTDSMYYKITDNIGNFSIAKINIIVDSKNK